MELGPACVNPDVGLVDTQCLVRLFEEEGQPARQEWVSWERAYELCASTTGVINPLGQYHFMGIRGVTDDGKLWVSNSAQGYMGVYDTLDAAQFAALGPVQVVVLER